MTSHFLTSLCERFWLSFIREQKKSEKSSSLQLRRSVWQTKLNVRLQRWNRLTCMRVLFYAFAIFVDSLSWKSTRFMKEWEATEAMNHRTASFEICDSKRCQLFGRKLHQRSFQEDLVFNVNAWGACFQAYELLLSWDYLTSKIYLLLPLPDLWFHTHLISSWHDVELVNLFAALSFSIHVLCSELKDHKAAKRFGPSCKMCNRQVKHTYWTGLHVMIIWDCNASSAPEAFSGLIAYQQTGIKMI